MAYQCMNTGIFGLMGKEVVVYIRVPWRTKSRDG